MSHSGALHARTGTLAASGETYVQVARDIVHDLFGPQNGRSFAVRYWDGTVEQPQAGQPPTYTLVIRRPGALRRALLPPSELALGEAYLRDDIDIEGDMIAGASMGGGVMSHPPSPITLARVMQRLRSLPTDDLPSDAESLARSASHLSGRVHSRRRDSAAVRYHYDVGNDFYALWLDKQMVYSCAYFESGTEDIDTAQTNKLEHICRKLRLQPGERLLDIGCGWGGLVQYAAQHYGVHALGITLSEPQARLAQERITASGLGERCKVEVRDYRDLPRGTQFDKVVSIGMVEHVGRSKLPTYFAQAYRLTRPGGLFLNHGIVILEPLPRPVSPAWVLRMFWRIGAFNQMHVFPDTDLQLPGEVIQQAELAGFETRDVESLREHYLLTLRHWIHNLEAHHTEAVNLVGEQVYRVWRLYMSVGAYGFAHGEAGIIQTLLSRPKEGITNIPLTRRDLYE